VNVSTLLIAALAVMTLVALAILLLPLWSPSRKVAEAVANDATPAGDAGGSVAGTKAAAPIDPSLQRAPATAVIVLLSLPLAAGLAYLQLSNFDWSTLGAPTVAGNGESGGGADIVNQLAQRLAAEGGSVEEWRLLGRSLFQAGRFSEAENALREAYRQVVGGEPAVVAATGAEYAEAMIFADQRALLSDAGTLLEQVLELDPINPRGLWWGGLAAFERGEYQRSVDRWQALMANPQLSDPQMRGVLEQRIGMAQQLAAGGAPPPATMRAQSEAMAQTSAQAQPAGAAESPPLNPSLRVSIEIAPELGADANGYPLFIIARRPGVGGPPLAVVRRASNELPLQVELSDDDAMIPGRGISSVDEVEVVARISLSGNPVASSGDLFGSKRVRVDQQAMVEITISERTP
jgi:cytochrome c-type biogenesis protein CcmH